MGIFHISNNNHEAGVVLEPYRSPNHVPQDESRTSLNVEQRDYLMVTSMGHLDGVFSPLRPSTMGPSTDMQVWYMQAASLLRNYCQDGGVMTWGAIIDRLTIEDVLRPESATTSLQYYFIFCLIGYMTFLYQPSPPEEGLPHNQPFRIRSVDESTGHRYSGLIDLHVTVRDHRHGVSIVLKPLGDLLPKVDGNHHDSVPENCVLDTESFNAKYMMSTLGMQFGWTDVLGAHLDYHPTSGTVLLFRQPTHCLLNAVQGPESKLLPSCVDVPAAEVHGLMSEILLTIHLIFGFTEKSRACFDEDVALRGIPPARRDPLLRKLCSDSWELEERLDCLYETKFFYRLDIEFPILGPKLAYLKHHMEHRQPRTLSHLWRDNRNTYQWYTLWAVVTIAALALLLAIAQTVLAAIQVYYAALGE